MQEDLRYKEEQMTAQIEELITLQAELTQEQNDVEANKQVIISNWNGDDAEFAITKYKEISDILSRTADDLKSQIRFLQDKNESFSRTSLKL